MKIIFDARYTRTDFPDGITRFTQGLLGALNTRHSVVMLISDPKQLNQLPRLPWELAPSPTSPLEPFIARKINQLKPDIVFSPMQTMGSRGRDYRLILTVHDLIYYRHRTPPRDLPWWVRLLWRAYHLAWWPQRMLLNGSDAVVTVSETTKELIAEHRLTKRPVHVVYNAPSETTVTILPAAQRKKTLVYVGSYMPYKNVETLVAAMELLSDYELHLMSRVTEATRARLQAITPGARLVFHDGASEASYLETLGAAHALVTASREEGFGIPLVEAMRSGTPLIVSDIPIFREIAGSAAHFASPADSEAFADAVRELEDATEWERLSAAGRARQQDFNWQASAESLLQLLEDTVKG